MGGDLGGGGENTKREGEVGGVEKKGSDEKRGAGG